MWICLSVCEYLVTLRNKTTVHKITDCSSMCQFDIENNGTVMYNEAENELYRLTVQGRRNKRLLLNG
jgi:hypothetical protein